MAKLIAAMPKPASTPRRTAYSSSGAGPIHQAKATAATSAATSAVPNTLAGCFGFAPMSMPASRHHAFLNSGPYQMPPMTKADTAAATTASQFSSMRHSPSSFERVRLGGEAHAQRALADVDHAGQAHHRLEHLDVLLATGPAQFLVARQRAHFRQLAAVAQAQGRGHQAFAH